MQGEISSIQTPGIDHRQLLEALPDAVMPIGTDFTVRLVNDAFTRLSGVEPSRAIGKKCYDVFPGDLCRTPGCPMDRIKNGVESLRYEADKHCVCGRSAPGIVTARAYRSADGALAGIIEIISDILMNNKPCSREVDLWY